MTESDAAVILKKLDAEYDFMRLFNKDGKETVKYRTWTKRLLPWPYEVGLRVAQNFALGKVEPGKHRQKPAWQDILQYLKIGNRSSEVSVADVKWTHGDVVEIDGQVGVVETEGDYVAVTAFRDGQAPFPTIIYEYSMLNRIGEAKEVPPEQAEHWVRTWWERIQERYEGRMFNYGLEAAARRFGIIGGRKKPTADAEARLAEIRAGQKKRGGKPQSIGEVF